MSKDVLQISSDVVQGVCTSVVATKRGREMSSLLVPCCSGCRQSIALDSNLFFPTSAAVLPGSFSSPICEACFSLFLELFPGTWFRTS